MGREVDEAWIEEAVERYRRIEERAAEFERAARMLTVTVHSPDGLVEVAVSADGNIHDVRVGELRGRTSADVSRSVRAAVTAAADAAAWARQKLHAETFGEYRPMAPG
jgi:DNA-binding protein YbaB